MLTSNTNKLVSLCTCLTWPHHPLCHFRPNEMPNGMTMTVKAHDGAMVMVAGPVVWQWWETCNSMMVQHMAWWWWGQHAMMRVAQRQGWQASATTATVTTQQQQQPRHAPPPQPSTVHEIAQDFKTNLQFQSSIRGSVSLFNPIPYPLLGMDHRELACVCWNLYCWHLNRTYMKFPDLVFYADICKMAPQLSTPVNTLQCPCDELQEDSITWMEKTITTGLGYTIVLLLY